MSYPYYYPYFSARNINPVQQSVMQAELLALRRSQLLQEQAEIQLAVIQKQQQINSNRIRQYQQQLRSKQRINDILDRDNIINQTMASKYRQVAYQQELNQLKYQQRLRKINKLEKQRSLLQKDEKIAMRSGNKIQPISKKQIQNQGIIQQYQQQLLKKIRNTKSVDPIEIRDHNKTKKQDPTLFNTIQKDSNIIVNKKNQQNVRNKIKQVGFSNHVIVNKVNNQHQHKTQKSTMRNYHTLDPKELNIKNNTIETSNLNNLSNNNYFTDRKPTKSKNCSRKANDNKKSKSFYKPNTSRNANITNRTCKDSLITNDLNNNAMKKIQNRLKLSLVVYKDAKWKNSKHQIEHLLNTYEIEFRSRKQIKDKINNHPMILKKHLLVVQSR